MRSSTTLTLSPRGTLLIVGGGTQPPEMRQHFVDLAGGTGRASVVVIPLASETAEQVGAESAELFRGLGATATSLVPTRAQAEDPASCQLLKGVTAVWFSGGDQSRITSVRRGTPLGEALTKFYRSGGVICGTSAGAAIMSDSMITGDQWQPGGDTAIYKGDEFGSIARHFTDIRPGFPILLPH
jgi:cyanophycinase